jgi:hypothetical protein
MGANKVHVVLVDGPQGPVGTADDEVKNNVTVWARR